MKNNFFNKCGSYNFAQEVTSVLDNRFFPGPQKKQIKGIDNESYECTEKNLSSNKGCNVKNDANYENCDFEEATKFTSFGKYNWFLLFVAFWGYSSNVFSTASISFILPSAECDLNLSNLAKGMLNSVTLMGMIFTGFFLGILSDSVGRKKILLVVFASDASFTLISGFAQDITLLMISKFLSGLINGSGVAILTTFVAEFHAVSYRASITTGMGIFFSISTIILPLIAWLIIPTSIYFTLFNGYIVLPNWRIFLLVTSIPSFLSFISLIFTDESPKFLMSHNKNDEALRVFQKVYSVNTGKPKETFPVRFLKNENSVHLNEANDEKFSFFKILLASWNQMVPLFRKPYFVAILLPCFLQFFTALGMNTMRLWSPQLFASAIQNEKMSSNISDVSNICDLLVTNSQPEVTNEFIDCKDRILDEKIYTNSMIIGGVTSCGYLISCYMVKVFDRKWLLFLVYLLSGTCSLVLYWSTNSTSMVATISAFIAITSSGATTTLTTLIDIFPTSLRTTAVSLCLTVGRLGGVVGNATFPVFLDWNCSTPFIILPVVLFAFTGLTLLLPRTKGKPLE